MALAPILLVLLATGCQSYYPVDIHTPEGLQVVALGETVRVTTHGGEEREFEVTGVQRARISGASAAYTAQQIASLERLEGDAFKSVGYGLGVHVVVAVAVAVVATIVLASAAGAAIF